jgi:hypothetical protein
MNLNNHDSLVDPKKHVQNVWSRLELAIQDSHAMWKILLITFKGLVCAWYNNLELDSITSFDDLCTKLVTRFNTSIPAKKSSTELYFLESLGQMTSPHKHTLRGLIRKCPRSKN